MCLDVRCGLWGGEERRRRKRRRRRRRSSIRIVHAESGGGVEGWRKKVLRPVLRRSKGMVVQAARYCEFLNTKP